MVKLIKYDLRCGIAYNYKKILMFVLFIIVYNFIGGNAIIEYSRLNNIKPDVLDFFCYILGGPKFIPEGMLEIYEVPVMWLMIQIFIAYIVGYYAVTDLHKYGQHVLLRSVSRKKWWLSKIVWNAVTVIFMYAIVLCVTVVNAHISGAGFQWKLTDEIAIQLCSFYFVPKSTNVVLVFIFIMPVIVSLAISSIQMVIALISSPIIGFVVSQSITFLSTIYSTKWLISNYAMLSHSRYTCLSDIGYKEGIIVCFVVYLISVILGSIYFSYCNILPKSREI